MRRRYDAFWRVRPRGLPRNALPTIDGTACTERLEFVSVVSTYVSLGGVRGQLCWHELHSGGLVVRGSGAGHTLRAVLPWQRPEFFQLRHRRCN